ncbi:MAG: electron transfer flavoprotein subunit beta/FixA family protein [Flavobacteriales bacterium]|nr:electron transfer flavoprotein subunit beta/FixA family protein [Flavobacteriales bacterium]MCB9174383.1 electron transfer flavoprotein subunit beta/FixA family protein [Flavobacteriales bacterium]
MKILVCISKAPDTTSKIAFTDGNTKFDENGVQFIVNPYDEWYALVRGLELKEANGGNVTVLNVGGAENDPIIRKALAIGADDAVRIDAKTEDALFVAKQIANYATQNSFDIILFGKETIDFNGSQVAGMVAELMNAPYVSLASKLDMSGNNATIEREIEGGVEVIETSTPFVLSAAKGMAEARIPNMRGIMAARTKPLTVVAASDATNATKIKSFTLPPAKSACKYVDAANVEELVNLLHNEAKAI